MKSMPSLSAYTKIQNHAQVLENPPLPTSNFLTNTNCPRYVGHKFRYPQGQTLKWHISSTQLRDNNHQSPRCFYIIHFIFIINLHSGIYICNKYFFRCALKWTSFFITGTDSISYVVNTGANQITLNNSSFMTNLKIIRAKIKGISGTGVQISGVGQHYVYLKSDASNSDSISIIDTVCVPSSPYNLIPPQLLIKHMKYIGYIISDFSHNDIRYRFNYRSPGQLNCWQRTIAIPLSSNGVLTLHSNDGYTSSMSRAPQYCA